MTFSINFREIAKFTRYELLGSETIPIPEEFDKLSHEEKSEIYHCLWDKYADACRYLSSALNIDDLQAQYK